MTPTDRLLAYLSAYARKDLAAIAAMFSDDIELRDWKISVVGKPAALAETAMNFSAAKSIEIEPLEVYAGADGAAAELRIVVDGLIELRVVDTLSFDTSGRIRAIRAYLGRSPDAAAPAR